MSKAKDSATFPLVTSLSSDDALVTAKGNRIAAENVSKAGNAMTFTLTAGADRWVRVASTTGYGASCILAVSSGRINQKFMIPLTMLVTAPHGSSTQNIRVVPLSKQLVGSGNARYLVSKVRVTGREGANHVDLFMTDLTADATVTVAIACPLFTALSSPLENPEVGELTKEFNVDSSLWGGKYCLRLAGKGVAA